jgi:hypothetical protein
MRIRTAIGSWWVLLAAIVGLALWAAPQSRAESLAVYSFQTSTNTADSAATHLTAHPVTGWNLTPNPDTPWPITYPSPPGYLELNHNQDAQVGFLIEITANPGYTFQITDMRIDFYQYNYAGGIRSVFVSANNEADALLYNTSGGSIYVTIDPPAGVYSTAWNPLTARTDLTSLRFMIESYASIGQNQNLKLFHAEFDGNVFAVPEPSTALLVAAGLVLVCRRARVRLSGM